MPIQRLLIANRGEIAIRIARAAADLGISTLAVFSEDDEQSLHTRVADESSSLTGMGARAYLDADSIIATAEANGCDAIHPGYGFLSERADFAAACGERGITFVGPSEYHLSLFGDKARARAAAVAADVPILRGYDESVSIDQASEFFQSLGSDGSMMIKAIAGGGGRGTRTVRSTDELEEAYARCQSEAQAAFGMADVYVEEFVEKARHIEVQILGDLHGGIAHLGERECSVQRRNQKVVELAPAPGLSESVRTKLIDAAVRFASKEGYTNLGTFEFLIDAARQDEESPFVFIEANARLQVEHTVTEEVTGVDLVQTQIRLANGDSLGELGLDAPGVAVPRGYAVQARVNMETIAADGSVRPNACLLYTSDAADE